MNEELERMFSSENEKTLWHLTDLGVKDGMFGKYTLPKKAKGKAKFSDYAKSATNHNVSEEYLKLGKNAYILDDFGSQYLFTKNKYGINTIDRCYSPTPLFCFGRRPVIQLSDDIIEELKSSSNNLKTIKIGSYPQEKVKGKLEQQLNEKLKSGSLTKSDYLFKQDEYYYDENDKCYYHKKNAENNKTTKDLSSCYDYNGERYFENNQSWFKVSPVEWIVDSENKRLISKEVIDNYSNRNIETSDIAQVIFQDITRKYSKYYDRLNDNKKMIK